MQIKTVHQHPSCPLLQCLPAMLIPVLDSASALNQKSHHWEHTHTAVLYSSVSWTSAAGCNAGGAAQSDSVSAASRLMLKATLSSNSVIHRTFSAIHVEILCASNPLYSRKTQIHLSSTAMEDVNSTSLQTDSKPKSVGLI